MNRYERSADQIEQEIRGTRRDIDRTLGALQYKLSPGQLLDQALGYFKGGPGEFATNLGRSVRDNPLPVTLFGVSLAWLMFAPRGSSHPRGAEASVTPMSEVGPVPDPRADWTEAAETYSVGEQPEGTGGVVGAAGEAMAKAREMGTAARERLDLQRARAGEYAHRTWDQGRHATLAAGRFLEDYPLAVAALGLAVGAAAAACLPRTRREDELLGETSDQLKRAVSETVREAAADETQGSETHPSLRPAADREITGEPESGTSTGGIERSPPLTGPGAPGL